MHSQWQKTQSDDVKYLKYVKLWVDINEALELCSSLLKLVNVKKALKKENDYVN